MEAERCIVPIEDADLPSVSEFLAQHFGTNRSREHWQRAITPRWCPDASRGYILRAGDGRIGGVIVQIQAERVLGADRRRTCSLSSWMVLPEYRDDSIQLLVQATRDAGTVYVNFTPAPRTDRIFRRLGFQSIDTTEWVVANVPTAMGPALTDPKQIAAQLSGRAAEDLMAHMPFRRLRHLGLWADDGNFCHVCFIKARFHLIPAARVLYASHWNVFTRVLAAFRSAALLRFGLPLTMVERRRLADRPAGAIAQTAPQLVLYRGEGVGPQAIDGLYSELVTFA
jgi:hypothetical protein